MRFPQGPELDLWRAIEATAERAACVAHLYRPARATSDVQRPGARPDQAAGVAARSDG